MHQMIQSICCIFLFCTFINVDSGKEIKLSNNEEEETQHISARD